MTQLLDLKDLTLICLCNSNLQNYQKVANDVECVHFHEPLCGSYFKTFSSHFSGPFRKTACFLESPVFLRQSRQTVSEFLTVHMRQCFLKDLSPYCFMFVFDNSPSSCFV